MKDFRSAVMQSQIQLTHVVNRHHCDCNGTCVKDVNSRYASGGWESYCEWMNLCVLQFCFWSNLIKWHILFEIFDGYMRIPDAWILENF